MSTLGAASELAAVNEMLAAIGESPVSDLVALPPSGETALSILRATSRDFQEEGHWFNSEDGYILSPGVDGHITVPAEVLSLDEADATGMNLIQRGERVYDLENRTYVFEDDVELAVVLHLEWDQIPSVARRYITAMATERFIDGFPGASGVTEARNRNLIRAKVAFEKAKLKAMDLNILNNSSISGFTRRS